MGEEGIGVGQAFIHITERKNAIGTGFSSTKGTRYMDIISIFFTNVLYK